jgi:putative peptide zinc metalloprotease protein
MTSPSDATRTAQTAPAVPVSPEAQRDTAPASHAAPQPAPRLAEGVELLGRFEDSGYKEPPFMARRADGQMIQLAPLLYLVAERADGSRTYEQIAAEVTQAVGRGLEAEDVEMLAEEKLRPLGVLAALDGSTPKVQKADPFLGLKLKTALIPRGVVRAITTVLRPLFWPPVILGILAALVAFDVWFFFDHGVAQSMRQLLYQPLFLLMLFGLVVLTAAFHEAGHATACRYGGAEPGVMGAGIYIVWPAFYTDVTDSYRLGKGGRLRTDLGGVYFNAIAILVLGGIYFLTGIEALLIPVLVAHMDIFRQLLPLLRLDGYHVLADLTGVPDLFARIKPILVSLIPGKGGDKRVTQLKPWVRVVVTLWVLVFVAFLAVNVAYLLLYAPKIFATGWDSFWTQYDRTSAAFSEGKGAAGAFGVLQMAVLALPAAGIAVGFGRSGGRLTRRTWRATAGNPMARTAGMLLIAGVVGLVAFLWWPDPRNYQPIGPGEQWTLTDAGTVASSAVSGRPDVAAAEGVRLGEDPARSEDGHQVVDETEGEVEVEVDEQTPSGVEPSPTASPASESSPEPTVEPSPEPTAASPEPTTVTTP